MLPNGGGGYQVGSGNRAETMMGVANAPQVATATTTLTTTQVVNQWLLANPGTSAASYTLPTGAQLDAAVPNANAGNTFDLSIINIGTSSGAVTLVMASGVTDGGNAVVAIPVTSSALFRFRKTADSTFVVYRIG